MMGRRNYRGRNSGRDSPREWFAVLQREEEDRREEEEANGPEPLSYADALRIKRDCK